MPRVLRVTLVATCLIALAACGSSGGGGDETADTTGITTASTGGGGGGGGAIPALDAACTEGQQAVDAASADIGAAFQQIQTATNRDEFEAGVSALQDAVGQAQTALSDFKSAVQAVDVPADVSDALDQLTSALDDQIAVAQQLADAPTDSAASVSDAFAAVQQDDTAARQARNDAASALGTNSCAAGLAGGSSGGAGGGGTTSTTAAG